MQRAPGPSDQETRRWAACEACGRGAGEGGASIYSSLSRRVMWSRKGRIDDMTALDGERDDCRCSTQYVRRKAATQQVQPLHKHAPEGCSQRLRRQL